MTSDEGIQLHLFDMDKYADTIDEDHIIFVPTPQTHIEFTALPFHGNTDSKFCIKEVSAYGNINNNRWIVQSRSSEPETFESMSEAIRYIETLTGKTVKFRGGG